MSEAPPQASTLRGRRAWLPLGRNRPRLNPVISTDILLMGNLCLLATNSKKKTGAFLKKTSPTVLRLGVLTHTEPVKILFNHISVEQLWVFLFHVALLQVIRV